MSPNSDRARVLSSMFSLEDIHTLAQSSNELTNDQEKSQIQELEDDIVHPGERFDTPCADGGRAAWLFLAGCFVLEALVWGFPFSFGVFQSYYSTHPPFSERPGGIAAIGTCSTGVMYLFAPISLYILEAFPFIRRLSSIIGLIIVLASLIGSSFATKVWQLILTQGVLYGIGGSLLYAPTMFYLDEWFIRKKGLAFGIMWAGTGTVAILSYLRPSTNSSKAGLVFPFLLSYLLTHCGYAKTLRIWSLILLALCAPLIYFVRPRLPPKPRQVVFYTFLKTRTHFFLQLSNILESLGFFLPSIYLVSYTRSLSPPLSTMTGTLLLALLNVSSVFGAISMGFLCDKLAVNAVITISTLGTCLSVFIFWGLGDSIPMLVIFSLTYGFFGGGFSAIWTGMMKDVQRAESTARMGTLMGVFAAGRGVGAVASGPLSEVLLKYTIVARKGEDRGYNGEYGVVIMFTGVSALLGLVCLGNGFKLRKH